MNLINLICLLRYLPLISSKNAQCLYNLSMRFIADKGKLQAGLFTVYQARFGAQTAININFIPDLLQHIKRQLNSQELIRLQDYHLQNYLMQLSISYKQAKDLSILTDIILKHIRSNNNFWYRHNNQQQINQEQQLKHHAISNYHKDMMHLKQTFANIQNHLPFTPSYNTKTTKSFTFQLLHSNTEPHFGTRQPLNYIAYIPSFLIFKYSPKISPLLQQNRQEYKIQLAEQNQQAINKEESEQKMKVLQQCIIFLLSNKTEILPTYKSNKDNSQQQQVSSQKSQSDGDIQDEYLPQKSILQQFLQFVQKEPSLIKFPNSHHLHILTYNLINICQRVYETKSNPQSLEISAPQSQNSSYLNQIVLDPQLKQAISLIADKSLSELQVSLITTHFLYLWESKLKLIMNDMRQVEESSINKTKGWLNTPSQMAQVKQQYQQMLDNPSFVQLTKYRALGTGIPWKEEDYLKFLKGLNQFFNIPTNNKKIAVSMGDGFQPNHVKHVKGVYLTVMKERIDRGECGGGKRGKSLSKLDFIEKDINNFSMRWFEKAKKIKKRKQKRKRRNSDSNQCEEELDSEY